MNDWIPVQNFPGYSVNSLGQVRRDSSGRILSVRVTQYGTPYVSMMRDWGQHPRSLSLLVARAFMPEQSEAFDTPINLDGDRFNCRVENLMWRPRWFAIQYNRQFRVPYDRPIKAALKAVDTKEVFPDSLAAATRYGLLERDVVLSIEHHTLTWPTYQRFEIVE